MDTLSAIIDLLLVGAIILMKWKVERLERDLESVEDLWEDYHYDII